MPDPPASVQADGAEIADEEAIALLDVERPSLLDVVVQRAEDLGLVEKIQRVVIAGKYAKAQDSGDAVKDMIDNAVRQTEESDEDGGYITGLTIMLPGCFLSIIEGPQRLAIGTLRLLQDDPNSRYKELLASAHMFSSIQDTPGRSFPIYASRTLALARADGITPEKETVVKLIPEIAINLQNFGKLLRSMDEGAQARELDELQRKYSEHLPRVEDVLGLVLPEPWPAPLSQLLAPHDDLSVELKGVLAAQCNSEDVMSLEEFFDLYYNPSRCLGGPLDSEVCWPLPPTLRY
jgi:hypothetical protein